ncbi:unnamed protein product [Haemonchus placei]|uniref:Uncharacterized protein n=1 Tax=Haemonchus placei TaxID=6290 RepID=A0A0N4X1I8_HAEPC|nr:unnamed protein product [Haemonchus placei]
MTHSIPLRLPLHTEVLRVQQQEASGILSSARPATRSCTICDLLVTNRKSEFKSCFERQPFSMIKRLRYGAFRTLELAIGAVGTI